MKHTHIFWISNAFKSNDFRFHEKKVKKIVEKDSKITKHIVRENSYQINYLKIQCH